MSALTTEVKNVDRNSFNYKSDFHCVVTGMALQNYTCMRLMISAKAITLLWNKKGFVHTTIGYVRTKAIVDLV